MGNGCWGAHARVHMCMFVIEVGQVVKRLAGLCIADGELQLLHWVRREAGQRTSYVVRSRKRGREPGIGATTRRGWWAPQGG